MAQQPSVLIGHDAELFVARQDGNPVPACGLIGGTKRNPLPLPKSKFGVKYQEDGVTLEFNQSPVPAVVKIGHISPGAIFCAGYKELCSWAAKEKNLLVLSPRPFEVFSKEALNHPQALTLGCDPDYSAYEPGIKRIPPSINDMGTIRCAAGHIHIGYDKEKLGIPDFAMVRMLDALVYTRWLHYDPQKDRRKFYGLAGLYRPKDYGVEWRTPSNFWLNHPSFVDDVAACAYATVTDLGRARGIYGKINFDEVQKTINSDIRDPAVAIYYDRLYRELIKGVF